MVVLIIAAVLGSFCILGVLAAIAIPAYMKYIKRSKASEAQGITRQLADETLAHYRETCEWPRELPRDTDPATCCGGEKCAPDAEALDVWSRSPLTAPQDKTYFSYRTTQVDADTYRIIAETDFQCGGEMHTVTVDLEAAGGCKAQASPAVTTHEFE